MRRLGPALCSPLLPLAASLILLIAGVAGARAEPMTDDERHRLLAHLEMTEAWLVDELAGLSAEQLAFRPDSESWSIAQVVEHLAIAEPQYWQQGEDSLARPATGFESQATDEVILWYGIDRSRRSKTGDARVPDQRYPSTAAALVSFQKLRATMKERARSTTEDLRGRQLIDGNLDVYQWFLMISTHAQRHILQIREVKASEGYPRR